MKESAAEHCGCCENSQQEMTESRRLKHLLCAHRCCPDCGVGEQEEDEEREGGRKRRMRATVRKRKAKRVEEAE